MCSPPRLAKRTDSAPSTSTCELEHGAGHAVGDRLQSLLGVARLALRARRAARSRSTASAISLKFSPRRELGHALGRRARAPVALGDPPRDRGQAGERLSDLPRREDEHAQQRSGRAGRASASGYEQPVGALGQRVAAAGGAGVDQRREALDRGHDRALLAVVGGVDETRLRRRWRITPSSTRARLSEAPATGVERGELGRREVRAAHQLLQRARRAVCTPPRRRPARGPRTSSRSRAGAARRRGGSPGSGRSSGGSACRRSSRRAGPCG